MPPGAIPLTTTRLRAICVAQNIGAGQTGVLFSQACGLQFQDWVTWMLSVTQNLKPIPSPARKAATGGVPNSVIPDYVKDLDLVLIATGATYAFPASFIGEVKAVNGYLPPSYSQYQILGLVDVTRRTAAGTSPVEDHPPPLLKFTTTGNTKMSQLTLGQASSWGVAIWQEIVYENSLASNDPNPDLCIGPAVAMNPGVYSGVPAPNYRVNSDCTKLTDAPPNAAVLVSGDPDPPTVDP